MSILIYNIDKSKLIPIGREGYTPGQEQAKTYFDEVPKGNFTVAITDVDLIKKLGSMADLDLSGNHRILFSVDNEDRQRVGMTIYYYDIRNESPEHFTVSHVNCEKGSNYVLASKLLEHIEDAFYSNKDKKLDFYKKRLVSECGSWDRFRFNAIEFMCLSPKIDPVEMAVALKKDGFEIVFDDSSISRVENMRKMKMVERRFAEVTEQRSVDGLISEAEDQKTDTGVKDSVKNRCRSALER